MVPSPLVVDLDGTLIRTDLLVESAALFIRQSPLKWYEPIKWLCTGKARLKGELARNTALDIPGLPYDEEILEFLRKQKDKGRQIILATASHRKYADQIAAHLGLFDHVMATESEINLSASNKRDLLVSEFGVGGFDYMANSKDDLPIWEVARSAYVVNPESGVERRARSLGNVVQTIRTGKSGLSLWARAFRVHQWLKNLLLFVPLLASHQLDQGEALLMGLAAFIFFSLCASSVYLLNDILDLQDDRNHPRKRYRPFASGRIPIKAGITLIPLLLGLSLLGSVVFLPLQFTLILLAYYGLTLAYSLLLKKKLMVDVIVLAMLYTSRIIAGTSVFGLHPTFWMLAFSMFIFLSLALVKRYSELQIVRTRGGNEKSSGRGYFASDLEMIASLGAASGYLSVLVFAMYINDQATAALYGNPQIIWLACPILLFWISRTWMLAHRGHMHDDPVVFAVKDRISLLSGALFGLIFWLAL